VQVIDPFGNRIRFNEDLKPASDVTIGWWSLAAVPGGLMKSTVDETGSGSTPT
jgi:hypothetical protein